MESMQGLSPVIISELDRLGAVRDESLLEQYRTIDGREAPYFVRQLLSYRFPQKKKYFTPDDTKTSFSVRFVKFNIFGTHSISEDDMEYFYIIFAEAGGGNYSLAIEINDSNPSDPYVHKLDSEDMSGRDGSELSLFLKDFQEQVKYSDGL